jgi:NAD(P)-dependent dehydrogenase (short-subunit alcohol dehydrogenase family)
MMLDLNGKTALVTGGSRGIGAATVRSFVGAGGYVVIHYGSNDKAARALLESLPAGRAHICKADLLSVAEIEKLWDEAESWRGRIDILVNNAGVYEKNSLSLGVNDWLAGWDRTMQINLRSTAQLCRRAVLHFRKIGGGILINVSSRAGHRGDNIDHLQYGASKAGMLALNRAIARNTAKENILAYGVAPGFVLTDLVEGVVKELGMEAIDSMYPTGRAATPEEVAAVILFLASGVAPQTTGNTIDLCGAADVR